MRGASASGVAAGPGGRVGVEGSDVAGGGVVGDGAGGEA